MIVKKKIKFNYVKEVFERYWEENVNGWSVASIRNYSGVYKSLFEILAFTAGVPFEEIEFSHLDNDLIDEFFFNLMHLPAQFSKRFTGKMTMGQVFEYSKRLKKGEDVAGLDEPTKKGSGSTLMDGVSFDAVLTGGYSANHWNLSHYPMYSCARRSRRSTITARTPLLRISVIIS